MFSIDEENDDGTSFEVADPASADPEGESVKREDRDRLHLLLKDLDETDRAAVILRYWYDYSEIEIAESLKLTVSAVKSRLHRARRALAGKWQEDEKRGSRPRTERRAHESPAF
jgi:RNA polymerase sigma-70 factor (ECF subfamily)